MKEQDNSPLPCLQARQYYCDYIEPSKRSQIPGQILEHIAGCQDCKAQIARLQQLLNTQSTGLNHKYARMVEVLGQHFAYIDGPVDCSAVKRLLAQLADPALALHIPTPITLHLDQCSLCSGDLALIRSWCLRPDQLDRLGQLLSGDAGYRLPCEDAEHFIHQACRFEFDKIGPSALAHVCLCQGCRDRLYLARAVLLEHIEAEGPSAPGGPGCQMITDAELFDLVAPLGLDLGNDQYASFLLPICGHLRACPDCLARVQRMHRELYKILSRPNSEVVTYYSLGQDGHKINPRPSRGKSKLTKAAMAAVVLAGAIGLWALVGQASADPIGGLLRAFGKVRCLHIMVQDRQGPLQEFWLDRDAGICLVKGPSMITLWDLAAGAKRMATAEGGTIQVQAMDQADKGWVRAGLSSGFGLVPFTDRASIPASATCIRAGPFGQVGLDVYELIWPGPYSVGRRRWLVTVDHISRLPQRAEYYSDSGDGQWELDTVLTVDYPTSDRVRDVLRQWMPVAAR